MSVVNIGIFDQIIKNDVCRSVNKDLMHGEGVRTGCLTVLGSMDDGDVITGLDKLAVSVPAPRNIYG